MVTAKKAADKPAAKKASANKTNDPRGSAASTAANDKPKGGQVTQEHVTTAPRERRKVSNKDEAVTVRIPHAFNLQVYKEDGTGTHMIRYEAGIDEMPRSHAEHEYAVANGVEIVED